MIKGKGPDDKVRTNQSTVDMKFLKSKSNTELWKTVEEMMDKPLEEIDGDFVDACLNILQDRAPVAEDYDSQSMLERLHEEHPAIFELEEDTPAEIASPKRRRAMKLFRYAEVFAAAMLCLVITANAFGRKPIQDFIRWVGDTIQIYTNPSGLMELPPDDPSQYHSLEEALEACGASSADRITWIPEDYSILYAEVILEGAIKEVMVVYEAERGELVLDILYIGDNDWRGVVESDPFDRNVYEHNGMSYYVTTNYDRAVAGWMDEEYMYDISGNVTKDEIRKIVESVK